MNCDVDDGRRYEKNPKKPPCISFCPIDGFKSDGFYFYDDETFINATYSMDEIFEDQTIEMFRNKSMFRTVETNTLLMGRCFTICYMGTLARRKSVQLTLKANLDLKVFIHLPEEEMWLNMESEFPANVPDLVLNCSQTQYRGIRLRLTEVETTVLSKPNERCKVYSEVTDESAAIFAKCCKDVIAANLIKSFNCSIPAMDSLLPRNSTLRRCRNELEAIVAIADFRENFTNVEDHSGKRPKP